MGEPRDEFAPPKTRNFKDGQFTERYQGHEHAEKFAERLLKAIGKKPIVVPSPKAKQAKIEAVAKELSEYHYTAETVRVQDTTLALTDDEIECFSGPPERLKLMQELQKPIAADGDDKGVTLQKLKRFIDSEKVRIARERKGATDDQDAAQLENKPHGTQHNSLVYQARAAKLASHLIKEALSDDQHDGSKIAQAQHAVQSLLYIDTMTKLAKPDDASQDAMRKRMADAKERCAKLIQWDKKLEKDVQKNFEKAEQEINFGDPIESGKELDIVDSRLDLAVVNAKRAAQDRISKIDKAVTSEIAKGASLTDTVKHLTSAKAAAKNGLFEDAKHETDEAQRYLIIQQGKRNIDITSELKPLWTQTRDQFLASLKDLESKIKAHQPPVPETTLLSKMGIMGWTQDPIKKITVAVDSLTSVPAGPAGMVERLTAVAVFRQEAEALTKHPSIRVMKMNPWNVGLDAQGLNSAIARMEQITLEADG